jgi:hypothetical protein
MSYRNETKQESGLPEVEKSWQVALVASYCSVKHFQFTENLSPFGGTAASTVCHQQRK